jgi:hypothetical protein
LNFWGIYEMDFPEGSNVKAPRGFRYSLWSLFLIFFYRQRNEALWMAKGVIEDKRNAKWIAINN